MALAAPPGGNFDDQRACSGHMERWHHFGPAQWNSDPCRELSAPIAPRAILVPDREAPLAVPHYGASHRTVCRLAQAVCLLLVRFDFHIFVS
jgi:hypothetical protein